MTLVIAKKTKNQIIILSDTRIFDPQDPSSRSNGMLKTTFLSPSVALAFTGDPTLAEQHVRAFAAGFGGATPYTATVGFFASATFDNANEYALAFAGPKRLFKLASGRSHEVSQLWLGSKDGFELFQKGPASDRSDLWEMNVFGPDIPDNEVLADRYSRFQNVLESPLIPDVGDFTTVAVSPNGLFHFTLQGSLHFDAFSSVLGPRGNPLLSASPHNRDYRYTAWAPKEPAVAAMAYVYPSASKAFLFYQPDAPFAGLFRTYDGLPTEDLLKRIEQDTGHEFLTIDLKHVGAVS